MAHSDSVHCQNLPPRLLPQKRAMFEETMPKDVWRKLPNEYRKVAEIVRVSILEGEGLSLESINPNESKYASDMFELAYLTINHRERIDYLLNKFCILENNQFLNEWVAKVLIAEMLWGKQHLISCSDEVEAIRYYEEELRESFLEVTFRFQSLLNSVIVTTTLPVYVRINLLSISIEEAIQGFKTEGWQLLPPCETYLDHAHKLEHLSERNFMKDFHIPELFVFPPGTSFYNNSGYLGGKLLLQDKGSCLASKLLNPEPGCIVLDLFAAPGLKTNHIANLMKNNGVIYANDIHPERFTTMSEILGLTNVTCVQPVHGHYLDFKDCSPTHILVDPSCSYSGIFTKEHTINQDDINTNEQAGITTSYEDNKITNFTSLTDALRHVLISFQNAKRVVYTTCSIFPEEGEKVVDAVLKEVGQTWVLLDLKEIFQNEWKSFGSKKYKCGNKCISTKTITDRCQGYFIAVFERNHAVSASPLLPPMIIWKVNTSNKNQVINVLVQAIQQKVMIVLVTGLKLSHVDINEISNDVKSKTSTEFPYQVQFSHPTTPEESLILAFTNTPWDCDSKEWKKSPSNLFLKIKYCRVDWQLCCTASGGHIITEKYRKIVKASYDLIHFLPTLHIVECSSSKIEAVIKGCKDYNSLSHKFFESDPEKIDDFVYISKRGSSVSELYHSPAMSKSGDKLVLRLRNERRID